MIAMDAAMSMNGKLVAWCKLRDQAHQIRDLFFLYTRNSHLSDTLRCERARLGSISLFRCHNYDLVHGCFHRIKMQSRVTVLMIRYIGSWSIQICMRY